MSQVDHFVAGYAASKRKRCRIYFYEKGAEKGAGFISKGLQQFIRSHGFAGAPILIAVMVSELSDAWVGSRG